MGIGAVKQGGRAARYVNQTARAAMPLEFRPTNSPILRLHGRLLSPMAMAYDVRVPTAAHVPGPCRVCH